MARTVFRPIASLLATGLSLATLSLAAMARPAWADEALEKPVSKLVTAVRYGKDDLAIKNLDGESQGAVLLGPEWTKGTPDQRKEFVSLFHKLFAAIAFPKIRDNFKNLSTMAYEPAKPAGDRAPLTSTIVIDHPLKKEEWKVRYDMHKTGEGWKVVDVTVLGTGAPSFLEEIRDQQVKKLFAQMGGWDGLLKVMRERLTQVRARK